MFRTLLCTAALTVVALTASQADAGKFNIRFGGGGGGNHGNHGFHWNKFKHHNYHNHYRHKAYHAPVVTCYYQVCFTCDAWNYKRHERFTCPQEAQAYALQLEKYGYWTSISKTCHPYPAGHIIYKNGHNHWLP